MDWAVQINLVISDAEHVKGVSNIIIPLTNYKINVVG